MKLQLVKLKQELITLEQVNGLEVGIDVKNIFADELFSHNNIRRL